MAKQDRQVAVPVLKGGLYWQFFKETNDGRQKGFQRATSVTRNWSQTLENPWRSLTPKTNTQGLPKPCFKISTKITNIDVHAPLRCEEQPKCVCVCFKYTGQRLNFCLHLSFYLQLMENIDIYESKWKKLDNFIYENGEELRKNTPLREI